MDIKKNPQARLENYSRQFLLLGLVLTLFSTHVALNHKTFEKNIAAFDAVSLTADEEEELIITHRIQPIKPPPPPPVMSEIIEVVKDDELVEETIIESTETDENDAIEVNLDLDDIEEASEGEEIIEDIPFSVIENAPIFPGCKGSKEKLRICFAKKISKHIGKRFNTRLASDLGLTPGKKRIFVIFTIDKKGNISDIQARAPHPRLQKEAKRVVNTLPKMTPGKQRGIPVNVKYSLPIAFEVVSG